MGMIQVHCIYCVLYFYYYYICSTSDHQALDPGGWGPLLYRASSRARTRHCCRRSLPLGAGWAPLTWPLLRQPVSSYLLSQSSGHTHPRAPMGKGLHSSFTAEQARCPAQAEGRTTARPAPGNASEPTPPPHGDKPGHTLETLPSGNHGRRDSTNGRMAGTRRGCQGQGPAGRLAGLTGSHVPGVDALVTANMSQ